MIRMPGFLNSFLAFVKLLLITRFCGAFLIQNALSPRELRKPPQNFNI